MSERNVQNASPESVPERGVFRDGSEEATPTVSVVIVTYNEADRIRRCLDSVFELCEEVPSFEVVLVDSNSSDETVQIASDYPITILRIPSDDLSTPAAGRYVGTRAANGEFVLFVDGDMELSDGWLSDACRLIREHPDVAAVDGHLNENRGQTEVENVDAVRGVALYDAKKLTAVGGFDPFLQSLEDIDVGFQLVEAGYRLCRLPLVVAEHPVSTGPQEPLRRLRNGYVRGTGQAVRKSVDSPRRLARHLYRLRKKLVVGPWGALGVLSLLSPPLLVAWVSVTVAMFYLIASKKGLDKAVHIVVGNTFTFFGILWGFRDAPRPASEYPLDRIETVKVAE